MIDELTTTTTTHNCPHCESELDELGVYDNRAHFACPNCGANVSVVVWRRIETKDDDSNETQNA